jgi:broad specificity phosphatase PhoE
MTTLLAALVVALPRHITFVRHSETVANATGKYNSRTLNTFSAKGEKLIVELTEELLKGPRPDAIFVSPSPRALRTIAPYLRRTRRTALVWPTLYECCTERPRKQEAKSFGYGAKIVIPADIKDLFVVMPGMDRLPAPKDYGEGLAQVRKTVSLIKNGFRGGRLMLVGHSVHGGKLLKALTGKSYHVKNAEPIEIDLAPR